jgi:arylsulfatase
VGQAVDTPDQRQQANGSGGPLGGAVVSEDYGPRGNEFTGEINWVQIDLDEAAEDLDHLITPEERLNIAMARQ